MFALILQYGGRGGVCYKNNFAIFAIDYDMRISQVPTFKNHKEMVSCKMLALVEVHKTPRLKTFQVNLQVEN